MNNQLLPSMMCVDPTKLESAVRVFEQHGIDGLHVDVMDGHFVPNLQLGTDYCRYLAQMTTLPMDYHLMVEQPEDKIDWFPIREGDFVSVHVESTRHLQRAFDRIRAVGGRPIAALNPATPLCMIEEVLSQAAGILIMTVNPGFAGQQLVEFTVAKIRAARDLLSTRGYPDLPIEVDGNVSKANLVRMKEAGANRFVIGTSGFLKSMNPDDMIAGIQAFRALI